MDYCTMDGTIDEVDDVMENGSDSSAHVLAEKEALQRLLESINAIKEHVAQREFRKYTIQRRGRTSFIYLANTGNSAEVY